MSPQRVTRSITREPPVVRVDDTVEAAVRAVLDHNLPAVPVVESDGTLAGVFGEREFLEALFPRYFSQLKSAKFVSKALDEALEKRAGCIRERVGDHMFTEHVDVGIDASDGQIAETFFHHRVLLLPVVEQGKVVGVVTRRDFFRALAERVLDSA